MDITHFPCSVSLDQHLVFALLFSSLRWSLFSEPDLYFSSDSGAGRLKGNKNQMDIVQKMSKWLGECKELSGMERCWNFSAIKWDLSPVYHSQCRRLFTLTETPMQ